MCLQNKNTEPSGKYSWLVNGRGGSDNGADDIRESLRDLAMAVK